MELPYGWQPDDVGARLHWEAAMRWCRRRVPPSVNAPPPHRMPSTPAVPECVAVAPSPVRTMSIDRKHVIASALVVFVAWALLTDAVPALRWIPHAFVAGAIVTLLALFLLLLTTFRSADFQHDRPVPARPRRPAFAARGAWQEEKTALKGREEYRRPTIFPQVIHFSKAVDGLLDLILRDFVTSWYGKISPRPLFQHEIDRTIRSALLSITARLMQLDMVELGVSRMLPIITNHLKDFYDAERLVRGKDLSNNVTESDELSMAIAAKFRGGRLHTVASLAYSDPQRSVQAYLRNLVERVLPAVLPSSMLTSASVRALVRELVACAVLAPLAKITSDPDTWNQLIVNVGGAALQDRKSVRKLRAALDQHAPASPRAMRKAPSAFPRIRPYDNERQFERFVRAARKVSTLTEARRFRNEILSQLRRDSQVEGQDAAYLRRLETGKRLLDQRIAQLSANSGSRAMAAPQTPSKANGTDSRKRKASLRDLINDAAGLGYFMEHMDRQRLMTMVQFYLVVDGFRGPLEGDQDEPPSSIVHDPDRMDIGQMYSQYLTRPELRTPSSTLQITKQYLKAGSRATIEEYVAARRAVLQTQTRVYNIMNDEQFDPFKKSDLYYKWLAIDDSPAMSSFRTSSLDALGPQSPSRESPLNMPQRPAMTRPRDSELRRAVFSSTDLKGSSNTNSLFADRSRRSLDDTNIRPALFDDDVEDERMVQSVASLGNDDSDTESAQQAQEEAKAVSAMQLALDDIVGDEQDKDSLLSERGSRPSLDESEPRRSLEAVQRPPLITPFSSERGKPSIASLGLVGAPSARGVFVDDLFGDEAQKFLEDEREESDGPEGSDDDQVQEAAPGDLGLAEAIDILNADIERLSAQRSVLDSLTAKAELTNNTAELRILRKSEQSLQREIRRKEMQKQQYIVQESDNSLYGRAAVSIKSVMVGREEDGHEFALYVIEVRRQAGDQMPAATWAVTRRYSQFHELHKRLRARFPSVRELDFPRRQTLFTLQRDFLQKRRVTLEKYLRALLLVPAICRSRELRAFLSQAAIASNGDSATAADPKDFVSRIYNSVSDGVEDFLGNIPVLDQLSVAGQNLISAATAHINNAAAAVDSLDPATHDPATAAEAEKELNAYDTAATTRDAAVAEQPFVTPICDLFLETFELAKGHSWLRGRTVVVVLHQLLGGTIERKVREAARGAMQDESLTRGLELVRGMMWPDGALRPTPLPRTAQDRARTRKEAGLLLAALMPDLAGGVVGKAHAQAASRKIMAVLNNPRLNLHLIFTLIDEVMSLVFPEISLTSSNG